MSSRCRDLIVAVTVALCASATARAGEEPCHPAPTATTQPGGRVLRVGADANNLPFTDDKLAGMENKIAAILAEELKASPTYVWRAQRRGFFRHALKEGECDVVLAVPAGFDMGLTTRPYYRSSYAFVYRDGGPLAGLKSLDDPRLKQAKIGIQLVGDDGANAPPAHALGARGLATNLVGYTVLGDYRETSPAARVVRAVDAGEVDIAVAWGPVAGYFAATSGKGLRVVPIAEEVDPLTKLPMTFDICMAVRRSDPGLRDQLDAALDRRRADVRRVVETYHVPLLPVRPLPPKSTGDDD